MKLLHPEILETLLDFHRRLVLIEDEITDLYDLLDEGESMDRTIILNSLAYCLYLSDLAADLPEIEK